MSFLNAFFASIQATQIEGPPLHYGNRGASTGLQMPGIPGAQSMSVWVRKTEPTYVGFLVDLRPATFGYWWEREEPQGMRAYQHDTISGAGYPAIANTFDWVRVYIETPAFAQPFFLFCRNSEDEVFPTCNFGAMRVYSRTWTAAEIANPRKLWLADSVLANYDGTTNATQLLDTYGGAYHGRLIGPPENFNFI